MNVCFQSNQTFCVLLDGKFVIKCLFTSAREGTVNLIYIDHASTIMACSIHRGTKQTVFCLRMNFLLLFFLFENIDYSQVPYGYLETETIKKIIRI